MTAGDAQQVGQGGSDLIQASRGRGGAPTAGQVSLEEGVDRRSGHALDGDVLGGEPDAEVLDDLDVLLDGALGMAALVEVSDVGFDPGTEGVGPHAGTDAGSAEEVVQHGCPPFGSKDRPGGSWIMWTNSNHE